MGAGGTTNTGEVRQAVYARRPAADSERGAPRVQVPERREQTAPVAPPNLPRLLPPVSWHVIRCLPTLVIALGLFGGTVGPFVPGPSDGPTPIP